MKRSGIGVCAVLGVVFALGVASCGGTSKQTPGRGSEAGAGAGAVGGEPAHQAGSGGSALHSGGWDTGGTLNVPGAAGEPSYAQGGFYGGGGSPNEEPPCEPGELSCDGPSVRECGEDGTGSTIIETCELSETCVAGECVAIACAPGERACRDGQVVECNDLGTDVAPIKTCGPDEYCIEQDGSALCNPTVCAANEPFCINQVASTCKADGSGPVPGGQTCGANAVCDEGECVDRLCTPGEKLCQHDDVYVCTSNGASATVFFDCAAEETCDPELAACRPRLCEPGKLGCDGTRIVKCSGTGLGWEQQGTDCDDTDQICVNGSCKTQTCVPGSTFCKNYDVYQCDEHGVASSLSQDCIDGFQHCAPYYVNTAYCTYNSCTPGTPMCNGNVLSKCADDGSGAAAGGTPCGDQTCSAGACHPKVCAPGEYFCQDGDLAFCYWDGLDYGIIESCGTHAMCTGQGDEAGCTPYDCPPGDDACFGNQIGTCSADGQGLASVAQNCASSGGVCSGFASCGATASDTLGISEELLTIGTNVVIGNVINVTSSRRVTLLEAKLVLAGPRSLRWIIYKSAGGWYEAVYDKVLANQTGSGYLSSGPISYTLEAGQRYYIGVAVSGGGLGHYYDSAPFAPYLTFGAALGGFETLYNTTLGNYAPAGLVYDMRFTTELP